MQLEESRPKWGILIGLLLCLGILASVPFFYFRPTKMIPYEIQGSIGKSELFSAEKNAWEPARKGKQLNAGDRIRTGAGAEVDLKVADQIRIRIKENSELEVRKPSGFEWVKRYQLHLIKGNLFGSTEDKFKGKRLKISTPTLDAVIRGTVFQIEASPENKEATIRVLRGSVKVRAAKSGKSTLVRELGKVQVKENARKLEAIRLTRQEWTQIKEAYELTQKSLVMEAKQIDLSKESGTLFKYVFDHGTFYTPNLGFADREFIKDEHNGEVHLQIKYDVFPTGSFVGMYIKTRYLDASKFKAFKFDIRGDADEGFPDSLRIELKGKQGLITAFNPRNLKKGWQTFEFPFKFSRSTPVSEVTIVFTNEKAGSHKTGLIYMKEIDLVAGEKPHSQPSA